MISLPDTPSLSDLVAFTYTSLSDFPSSDADILLAEILEVSERERITHGQKKEDQDKINRLLNAIEQRKNHRSVSSILGYWWFFNRKFIISDEVLTPRPETEVLVEKVLSDLLQYSKIPPLFDIGTGSGCIAITLSAELKKKGLKGQIHAGDISPEACTIARQNAERLQEAIEIRITDLFSAFDENELKNAVVVANLPYVPLNDRSFLEKEVLEGDPHLALFSGKTGIDLYTRFFQEIPQGVQTVYIEFHPPQSSFLSDCIKTRFPSACIEFFDDLEHQTRFLKADLHFVDNRDSKKP